MFQGGVKSAKDVDFTFPDAQWGWPIYLQNWVVLMVNVGKYTSPMEHLGLNMLATDH